MTDYAPPTIKPAIRTRTFTSGNPIASPTSPRTPLLGRSISSQFGSPGTFRNEQEDLIIYELSARTLSAGFAGESRPRCVLGVGPEDVRRVGDYRQYGPAYVRKQQHRLGGNDWTVDHELYRVDLRDQDLGLVADKFERLVRRIHTDYLQLDNKPRKAALVVPSLLPTPLLETALRVLFNHFSQPPSFVLLTSSVMACVGAGLRDALVVDIGWEETTVTAIGEFKEVHQKRTVRASRLMTEGMAQMLDEEIKKQIKTPSSADEFSTQSAVELGHAEDVMHRLAWCRSRGDLDMSNAIMKVPASSEHDNESLSIPLQRFSEPAETVLFAVAPNADHAGDSDDHELDIPTVMYHVLLALPSDLRALCISRIVVTGAGHSIPGLRYRLLQEIQAIIDIRSWDPVNHYGSATERHRRALELRSANIVRLQEQRDGESAADGDDVPLSPAKRLIQEDVPHADRVHDDRFDHITIKAERGGAKGRVNVTRSVVRGVETLGAWSGASLVASLRVKGVCEIEREEFIHHGLRDVDF